MSQNNDNMTVFKYNGHTFNFDIRDAEDSKKYEDAIEVLEKYEKNYPKTGKNSDMILAHSRGIKTFFDTCLGTGAGEKICTNKSNIAICYKAYDCFLDFVRNQSNDISQTLTSFKSRATNRKERRTVNKENKKQTSTNKSAKK